MSRPKSRNVGAGVLTRYRNGACTFTCRHDGCRAYWERRNWPAGLRQARAHAADHDATEARYVGTPWGVPAHELPSRRRRHQPRRLALAGMALVLAVVAFAATIAGAASRAAPQSPAPPIGVITTTPSSRGYSPTPAGPPSTDRHGQWISEPDPATSSTGGSR
jgi:hypothetical protein